MDLYTCFVCSLIGAFPKRLDNNAICDRCLHKKQYGEDVYDRCSQRGYHQTYRIGDDESILVVRSESQTTRIGIEDPGYYFEKFITCLCGQSAIAHLRSESSFDDTHIKHPQPAEYWALIDGNYTPVCPKDLRDTDLASTAII